jgi:hypothetical protein
MCPYASSHACEQIAVRYGIEPTRYQWIEAFLAVTDGRTLLAARERNREVHYVPIAGMWVRVVYSPISARFITALPFNSRRKNPPRHLSRSPCEALHTPFG